MGRSGDGRREHGCALSPAPCAEHGVGRAPAGWWHQPDTRVVLLVKSLWHRAFIGRDRLPLAPFAPGSVGIRFCPQLRRPCAVTAALRLSFHAQDIGTMATTGASAKPKGHDVCDVHDGFSVWPVVTVEQNVFLKYSEMCSLRHPAFLAFPLVQGAPRSRPGRVG